MRHDPHKLVEGCLVAGAGIGARAGRCTLCYCALSSDANVQDLYFSVPEIFLEVEQVVGPSVVMQ